MTIVGYLLFWLVLLVLAVANGAIREAGYRRFLDELPSHQLSTLTLCALFWVAATLFARKFPLLTRTDAAIISFSWVALTLLFECFMIVVLMKKPWSEVWSGYDVLHGRVWIVVPVWLALLPFMVMRHPPVPPAS